MPQWQVTINHHTDLESKHMEVKNIVIIMQKACNIDLKNLTKGYWKNQRCE